MKKTPNNTFILFMFFSSFEQSDSPILDNNVATVKPIQKKKDLSKVKESI